MFDKIEGLARGYTWEGMKKRIDTFIERKDGYNSLDKAFIEAFLDQIGVAQFLDIYKESAETGIQYGYSGGCVIKDKVEFFKLHRKSIIGWANHVFDDGKYDSVSSMLADTAYLKSKHISHKEIRDVVETNDDTLECYNDLAIVMVWLVGDDLCRAMIDVDSQDACVDLGHMLKELLYSTDAHLDEVFECNA